MGFAIRIQDSQAAIERKILDAISREMTEVFARSMTKIEHRIKAVITRAIIAQPEYESLKGGELKGQLGLDSTNTPDAIVRYWHDSMYIESVRPKPAGKQMSGRIVMHIGDSTHSTEISMDEAILKPRNAPPFSWLQYLLLEGDSRRLSEFRGRTYIYYNFQNPPLKQSRSGQGIMIPSRNGQWELPNAFRGFPGYNWFTRALDSVAPQIDVILEEEFTRAIQ